MLNLLFMERRASAGVPPTPRPGPVLYGQWKKFIGVCKIQEFQPDRTFNRDIVPWPWWRPGDSHTRWLIHLLPPFLYQTPGIRFRCARLILPEILPILRSPFGITASIGVALITRGIRSIYYDRLSRVTPCFFFRFFSFFISKICRVTSNQENGSGK